MFDKDKAERHFNKDKEGINELKYRAISQISELVKKCRSFVGSFRHSEILVRRLKKKQNQLEDVCKFKLVQDVPTGWNSTFDMIDSILSNKDALSSMMVETMCKQIKKNFPTEQEFCILNELCDLLQPLKDLTCQLSGKNYVTSSLTFPAKPKMNTIHLWLNELNDFLDSKRISSERDKQATVLNHLDRTSKGIIKKLIDEKRIKNYSELESYLKSFFGNHNV